MIVNLKQTHERLERWHKWFAWHPVYTEQEAYVWLQTIYRQRVYDDYGCYNRYSLDATIPVAEELRKSNGLY